MSRESAYAQAGVNIAAGQRATQLMKTAVHATFGPEVLSQIGAFGGLYEVTRLQGMTAPVLVASTDGVGTKTEVAARMGRWDTIGFDIVNHCVNDILVQGAQPLFFLDYVATAVLDAVQIATIVQGMAAACQEVGCALLGGETAEMPGVYQPQAVDVVGTIVGVVERADIIDGQTIEPGDAILGVPSTGLHTNGYTLARQALAHLDWQAQHQELGQTPGEALLTPHRSYLPVVQQLRAAGVEIRGLAHITGGGLVDNPPRIFPDGLGAVLWRSAWPEPAIFSLIQRQGEIAAAEMFHVFNMGLGMLVVVPAAQVSRAQAAVDEAVYVVGEMVNGSGVTVKER